MLRDTSLAGAVSSLPLLLLVDVVVGLSVVAIDPSRPHLTLSPAPTPLLFRLPLRLLAVAVPPPTHTPPQLGYMSSWSAHSTYRRQHPELPDPLVAFGRQLQQVLGIADADAEREGTLRLAWPVFLFLAKQPVPLQVGANCV